MSRAAGIVVGALLGLGWGQQVRSLRPLPLQKAEARLEEADAAPLKKPYILICRTYSGEVVERQVCESLDDPVSQRFMMRCLEARHVMLVSRAGSGCEKPAGASFESGSRAQLQGKAPGEVTPALFPNPSQETVTLQMPHSGPWTARLYNSLGQLVATHPFEGTKTFLALPPQKGLYQVVVEGAGQSYRLPLVRE